VDLTESDVAALAKLPDAELLPKLAELAQRNGLNAAELFKRVEAARLTFAEYQRTLKLRAIKMEKSLARRELQELAELERKVMHYEPRVNASPTRRNATVVCRRSPGPRRPHSRRTRTASRCRSSGLRRSAKPEPPPHARRP
jgi:hypothetical protein